MIAADAHFLVPIAALNNPACGICINMDEVLFPFVVICAPQADNISNLTTIIQKEFRISLSHAPAKAFTPRCVSLPIPTMSETLSVVSLLWFVDGLFDDALDG